MFLPMARGLDYRIFKGPFPPNPFYDSVCECVILKHSVAGKQMCGFGGAPADGSKMFFFFGRRKNGYLPGVSWVL